MRCRAISTLLLLAAASAAIAASPAQTRPTTAPATAPSDADNPFIINDVPLSAQPAVPLDTIVRFRIAEDRLVAETTLPAHVPQMMKVVGLPRPLQVTIMQRGGLPTGVTVYQPDSIQLTYVHDDAGHPLRTCLSTTINHINLSRDMVFADGTEKTVQFIQMPPTTETEGAVTLYVQTMGKSEVDDKQSASATSFAAFLRQHPKETSEYVRPMVEAFGPQPRLFAVSDGVALTVFPEAYAPPPAEQQQIRELVTQLGDESYPVRQAAAAKLEKIGIAAASVLVGIDRSTLQAEQASRIDAIVAHMRPEYGADSAQLRRDPGFLLDCALSNNPRLQTAAVKQLKAVTGRTLDLPPGESDAQRTARVYQLRRELMPPTTRPAAKAASAANGPREADGQVRDMR